MRYPHGSIRTTGAQRPGLGGERNVSGLPIEAAGKNIMPYEKGIGGKRRV